jgi:hypothetical protein
MSPDEILAFVHARKVNELLEIHSAILEELRERKIVRSSNGPVGDYAEFLFAKAFAWELVNNSQKGYDAKDTDGQSYQIKSRRITLHNGSRQLSPLRRLPEKSFDFLAGVLFNADYSIYRAVILPHSVIEPRCRFSKHTNGWLFKLEDNVWQMPDARDVTPQLKSAAAALGAAA